MFLREVPAAEAIVDGVILSYLIRKYCEQPNYDIHLFVQFYLRGVSYHDVPDTSHPLT